MKIKKDEIKTINYSKVSKDDERTYMSTCACNDWSTKSSSILLMEERKKVFLNEKKLQNPIKIIK